jgi:processive 1,2-diacylglycerol beta-glucosyltransferase
MKKILILTAGFGEGHNSAARGLRDAIHQVAPGEAEAEMLDVFALCYGRVNEFARKAYIGTINNAPQIWQRIYELLDSTRLLEMNLATMQKTRKRLEAIFEKEQPAAVVSVYPVYSFLIEQLYSGETRRPFPLITVITDSITVNSVWHRAPSDYYIVANEDTAAVLRQRGFNPDQIHVLGFPITPRLAVPNSRRQAPSANEGRRVLYMINFGRKTAPALLRKLLETPGIQLTVTIGRDVDLMAELEGIIRESGKEVTVYGWTDKLPELLMEHHLLITKAGGATVQEAIAARTPMIISQVVPGQEEGNAELITRNQAGMIAETPEEIAAAVERAFADDAAVWKQWQTNIARLGNPDSALRVAEFVLNSQVPNQVALKR